MIDAADVRHLCRLKLRCVSQERCLAQRRKAGGLALLIGDRHDRARLRRRVTTFKGIARRRRRPARLKKEHNDTQFGQRAGRHANKRHDSDSRLDELGFRQAYKARQLTTVRLKLSSATVASNPAASRTEQARWASCGCVNARTTTNSENSDISATQSG